MRIPRLYIDLPLSTDELVLLPKEKAHYISHVLRMKTGAAIKLFNNTGYEFDAVIVALSKKNAELEIKEKYQCNNESHLQVTLCLAVSRGQHMDYSIQKAVELGVNTIIPVVSEFSNVKLQADRLQNKMTHWLNIIISAAEQCGRSRLPELVRPVSFSDCLLSNIPQPLLILQPESKQTMQSVRPKNNKLSMLIGPEGGFSESEIKEACNNSAISINMGPRVLRAETAVVTALSNAQQLWGDLK